MLQHAYDGVPCQACIEKDDRFGHTCKPLARILDADSADMVRKPSHYDFFPGVEAIVIIARSMTETEFRGYCMGNALKYRLRAGKKFNMEEDIKKANFYLELFEKNRVYCVEG